MICKVKNCGDEEVQGLFGHCHKHYCEMLYWKWHPSRGVDGLIDFAFDCFPSKIERRYGIAEFQRKFLTMILAGIMKRAYTHNSTFMLKCFRGAAKSTWMTVIIPAYVIAYDLKRFIVLMNDSEKKAINVSMRRLKSAMGSEMYRMVFGDISLVEKNNFAGKTWNQSLIICSNKARTMVVAMGLNQPMNSLVGEDIRPDLWLCDDPESLKNTMTEDIRRKNFEIVFEQDIPAMDIEGMIVFAQTPIHRDGLYYKIGDREGVHCVTAPIYKTDDAGIFLRDAGELIPQWPERYPLDWCKAKERWYRETEGGNKEGGITAWNKNFLLLLNTTETRRIQETWIRYLNFDTKINSDMNWVKITKLNGEPVDEESYKLVNRIGALDPAVSMNAKACNTAISGCDIHSDRKKVVFDYVFGKFLENDVVRDISKLTHPYQIEMDYSNIEKKGIVGEAFRFIHKWHLNTLVIENVTGFEYVVQSIEQVNRLWYYPTYNHYVKILRFHPGNQQDKLDRVSSTLGNEFSMFNVYFTWDMPELRDEVCNIGSWSSIDIADSLHMIFKMMQIPELKELSDHSIRKFKNKGKKEITIEDMYHERFV